MLLTGIHLMRTGETVADLTLLFDGGPPYLPGLVAAKREAEHGGLPDGAPGRERLEADLDALTARPGGRPGFLGPAGRPVGARRPARPRRTDPSRGTLNRAGSVGDTRTMRGAAPRSGVIADNGPSRHHPRRTL
ncbi:hypothetical protein GCM10010116_53400 [Microbispora rosea subsp. aerata]|nr:hypothetical protein [Microbispora rosea]GGO26602.1 hypothetical protein GCM10010116_53400 [Microbispora rosea subsp. aerata]GIH58377.1 hypothetical protein Mro02_52910 [Microbispora rosea subsp. aerata]GLJ84050.1 hypothetical protein GCM10017588_27780 [Microbispora rosea subsp. aerata]